MRHNLFAPLIRLAKNETFIWCTNIIGILAIAATLILPRVMTLYTTEDAARAYVAALGWQMVSWSRCEKAEPDGFSTCHLFGITGDNTDAEIRLRCDDTPTLRLDPGRCTSVQE